MLHIGSGTTVGQAHNHAYTCIHQNHVSCDTWQRKLTFSTPVWLRISITTISKDDLCTYVIQNGGSKTTGSQRRLKNQALSYGVGSLLLLDVFFGA